jgi:hypothetical protein
VKRAENFVEKSLPCFFFKEKCRVSNFNQKISMKNIYLEPNEEIISTVDRLAQTKDDQINLVVPSGAQIWQSSINLKLLKREADNLNKKVTFIVTDDLGAEMAERVGFAVKRERELPIELAQQEEEEIVQEEERGGEVREGDDIIEVPKETIKEGVIKEDKEGQEENMQMSRSKENMIGLLVDELESEKKARGPFALLTSWKRKPFQDRVSDIRGESPQRRMADIITPKGDAKTEFPRRPISQKKSLVSKESGLKPTSSSEPVKIESLPEERVFSELEKPAGSRWSKLFIGFIIVTLIVAGLVSYLVLPNAEISITPKTESITFDLSVVGSKDVSWIDETLNQIPIQEVEVTKVKSREFTTTGEKEINEKARGYITIYNEYSSSPQTLVATTRFESSDGKVFRIPKSVTVPGAKIEEGKIIASTLKVEVIADQPGEDYNIGPSDFTIPGFKGTPKFAGFYGKSTNSMTGGYVGKIKIVLAKDLEEAENTLVKELKKEVKRALEEQIPTDLRIIEDGLREEITKISSNFKKGDQTDKFTLEVEATMRALLFKEEDLKNLVDLNLISRVSEDKSPLKETQKITWNKPVIDWSKGEVSFSLSVEEDVAWQIDIQSLKENLAGQTEVEVRKYLVNQPEIEKAKVSFWPFWVKKIPAQEKKIKVNIEL